MNIVQFDDVAFILPDDMDAFRKQHKVDVLFLNADEGSIMGIGPDDTDWRDIPSDRSVGGAVVRLRTKE